MAKQPHLSAAEARRELGVTAQTLYAYVSRGLIRSEPGAEGGRNRRYHAEDVRRLKERKEARRDPEHAARGALRWGAPVLDSALTLIMDGHLYYRGRDAVELARSCTVEEVAALLWTGQLEAPRGWFDGRIESARQELDVGPLGAMQIELARAEAQDPAAWDLRPERAARTGARILQRLTRLVAPGAGEEGTVSEVLQRSWAPGASEVEPLLRSALILLADHELSVASFTARCVASSGATPYAAVSAGIGAIQGVRHARNLDRVEALFREVGTPERARAVLEGRLQRGEPVPGFGHRLYPSGDPRHTELLRCVRAVHPRSPALALADAIAAAGEPLLGDRPTVEIGLVALARALELPSGASLVLFALGRTIGLVAHAIEQYGLPEVFHPRARYVGPAAGSMDRKED